MFYIIFDFFYSYFCLVKKSIIFVANYSSLNQLYKIKRKFILRFASLAIVSLSACTNSDEMADFRTLPDLRCENSKIMETEALSLANKFFGHDNSRASEDAFDVFYVKSAEVEDTVAYLFNKMSGDGFVMISAYDYMPSVLAFSNSNNLNYDESDDDSMYSLFIKQISSDKYHNYWMGAGTNGYYFKEEYNLFDKMIELCPDTCWHWDQGKEPYTKYVHMEYPNSPVGCVGIATGIVAIYACDSIVVNNKKFDLAAIREGMLHGLRVVPVGPPAGPAYVPGSQNVGGNNGVDAKLVMSYEAAMDSVALLLYYLGKDLQLSYDSLTGGSRESAFRFLKSHTNKVVQNSIKSYNPNSVVKCIESGEIVYTLAYQKKEGKYLPGHAFVIDGCCYDYDYENLDNEGLPSKKNIFVHCNWGENTDKIGYFYGETFELCWYIYYGMEYFSVKK